MMDGGQGLLGVTGLCSVPTEGQVHLPALRHLDEVGVPEGSVQQVGMGPRAGC
jgi:hypothetical protein